jgi:ribosomal protein L11 methyltransferase
MKMLHCWTRLSSTKWEDAWMERLRFVGLRNLAFTTWHGSRALKIEAYCTGHTAKKLVKHFGGSASKLSKNIWSGDPARPRGALSIRGRLKIFSDNSSWRKWRSVGQKPDALYVPAGMAFGTGEHATTATCLRLLVDVAAKLPANFTALDLGTGTGILAIAAKALGASRVEAIDKDASSVRIARQNAAINEFPTIKVSRGDVLKLAIADPFDVVLANLFSDVLTAAAPRIARAVKPGGWLVFSGILRTQVQQVTGNLRAAGFSKPRIIARGKWCAGICQKGQRKRGRP